MFLSSSLNNHSLSVELSIACLANLSQQLTMLTQQWHFPYFLVSRLNLTPFLLKEVKEGKAARGFSWLSAVFTFPHLASMNPWNNQWIDETISRFLWSMLPLSWTQFSPQIHLHLHQLPLPLLLLHFCVLFPELLAKLLWLTEFSSELLYLPHVPGDHGGDEWW